MMDAADCNMCHAETYEEYHGTPDTCPLCGGEMLDKIGLGDGRHWIERCGICDYSEVFLLQPNGTIVAVGHEPEEVRG